MVARRARDLPRNAMGGIKPARGESGYWDLRIHRNSAAFPEVDRGEGMPEVVPGRVPGKAAGAAPDALPGGGSTV